MLVASNLASCSTYMLVIIIWLKRTSIVQEAPKSKKREAWLVYYFNRIQFDLLSHIKFIDMLSFGLETDGAMEQSGRSTDRKKKKGPHNIGSPEKKMNPGTLPFATHACSE